MLQESADNHHHEISSYKSQNQQIDMHKQRVQQLEAQVDLL